jgi:hypothetical protein
MRFFAGRYEPFVGGCSANDASPLSDGSGALFSELI